MSTGLSDHPTIHRLDLGVITLPSWHPRAEDKTAPIYAYAVAHPDGVVLFDCGCANDSELINGLYRPKVRSVSAALGAVGFGLTDVTAVVLSHLHFDHCGQLRSVYGRPIYVQSAEIEVAGSTNYTVPNWAFIPIDDRRILAGDESIAEGLEIVSTPGHTPGHQSLIVRGGNEVTIIGGQCCYCASGFDSAQPEPDNLFDENWSSVARDSIQKLKMLSPNRLLLSHDIKEWSAPRNWRQHGE